MFHDVDALSQIFQLALYYYSCFTHKLKEAHSFGYLAQIKPCSCLVIKLDSNPVSVLSEQNKLNYGYNFERLFSLRISHCFPRDT